MLTGRNRHLKLTMNQRQESANNEEGNNATKQAETIFKITMNGQNPPTTESNAIKAETAIKN
jgi:hypothetical protein